MAKQAILRVGVEADPSGLGSVRGQVARGLNTMAAQFGQVRGMMQAAMALPAIGMLQNIMQARQEARDMAKDLMAPFSQALASTSAYDITRRGEVGQRMVAMGMDEAAARSERGKTERDIAVGLQAENAGYFEKAISSVFTGDFWSQMPAFAESSTEATFRTLGEMVGIGDSDETRLAQLRAEQSTALMTGDTGTLYAINQQMLRVMEKIEQKTRQP